MKTIDREKVRKAFVALRRNWGYAARMNYKCCMGCATAAAAPDDRPLVYYHAQDSDRAFKDGRSLQIRYCAPAKLENQIAAVAVNTVATLRAMGLEVNWDGDTDKTIEVVAPKEERTQ